MRSRLLNVTLVVTMTAGAFQLFLLAVVASDVLDDLGLSEGQFALIGSANTMVGAAFSPQSGTITDRIGPRRSVVAVLVLSGLGLLLTALASVWWVLLMATVWSGFAQGWCNPATNKLIADRVLDERRGVVTGIKQSGVQLGSFLAGATLPTLAIWLGWRGGIAVYGAVALAAAAMAWVTLDPDPPLVARQRDEAGAAIRVPLPAFIRRVAMYAFFMGAAVGATGRFMPLFAEEQLGMSQRMAGFAAALMGGLAVFTRVAWGKAAGVRVGYFRSLVVMAVGGTATCALLASALWLGSGLLWLAAIVGAATIAAWNSVAMLSVIRGVPSAQAGQASGVVVLGFLSGLTAGAIFTGFSFDLTDSYLTAWVVLGLSCCLAGLIVARRSKPMDDDGEEYPFPE